MASKAMQEPPIPPRTSSLSANTLALLAVTSPLLTEAQRAARDKASRRLSTASMQSNTAATSAKEAVEAQIEALDADVEFGGLAVLQLKDLFRQRKVSQEVCDAGIKTIEEEFALSSKRRELVQLRKKKRFFVQDLEEMIPDPSVQKIKEGYATLLSKEVRSAVTKQKPEVDGETKKQRDKKKKFRQAQFKQRVMKVYDADRTSEHGQQEQYCVVSGWHPFSGKHPDVKAAHIVPMSIDGISLGFMYGVEGSAMLKKDPKNALPLYKDIEEAWDRGQIAIVAKKDTKSKGHQDTALKLVVLDQDILNHKVAGTIWKDLNHKELEFRTAYRPAKRFLYFKFVMAYIQWKEANDTEKLAILDNITGKGEMWSTPGRYLRHSMLLVLAEVAGDVFPPQVFYNAFEEPTAEKATPEQIRTAALEMYQNLTDRRKKTETTSESDSSESSDSD